MATPFRQLFNNGNSVATRSPRNDPCLMSIRNILLYLLYHLLRCVHCRWAIRVQTAVEIRTFCRSRLEPAHRSVPTSSRVADLTAPASLGVSVLASDCTADPWRMAEVSVVDRLTVHCGHREIYWLVQCRCVVFPFVISNILTSFIHRLNGNTIARVREKMCDYCVLLKHTFSKRGLLVSWLRIVWLSMTKVSKEVWPNVQVYWDVLSCVFFCVVWFCLLVC